jgi:hypothetical protein
MKCTVDFQQSLPLKFLHKIQCGPCDLPSGYGILMSRYHNFPGDVILEASNVRETIRTISNDSLRCNKIKLPPFRNNSFMNHLLAFAENATDKDIRKALNEFV